MWTKEKIDQLRKECISRAQLDMLYLTRDDDKNPSEFCPVGEVESEIEEKNETLLKEIERLKTEVVRLEIESGHWIVQSMYLEREVEQFKSKSTAEQERAAVVAWLSSAKDSHPIIIKLLDYVRDCIEKGEHWQMKENQND